jgi:hypothetical protein
MMQAFFGQRPASSSAGIILAGLSFHRDRCTGDGGNAFPAAVASPASPARRRSLVASESFPSWESAEQPPCFPDQIPGSSLRILPTLNAPPLRCRGWVVGGVSGPLDERGGDGGIWLHAVGKTPPKFLAEFRPPSAFSSCQREQRSIDTTCSG